MGLTAKLGELPVEWKHLPELDLGLLGGTINTREMQFSEVANIVFSSSSGKTERVYVGGTYSGFLWYGTEVDENGVIEDVVNAMPSQVKSYRAVV